MKQRQQFEQQLKQAQTILIALPEQPSADTIAAGLTIHEVLQRKNKHVDIASSNFSAPKKLSFLKDVKKIIPDIPPLHKSVIRINTKKYPVQAVTYNEGDDALRVFITPKQGLIPSDAIQVEEKQYLYDLIITIGTSELSSLGSIFSKYKPFFFDTPIVNIDHQADNKLYGQINWVDINATSICEMMYQWYYADKHPPSGTMATTILTGMIDETHSFRSPQVTPKTLEFVSELIQAGARYQETVDNLYRTKSVGLLKLWGHVLHDLKADKNHSLAWATIPQHIFSQTNTNVEHLHDLLEEILNHTPEAKTVVLLFESPQAIGDIMVYASTLPPLNAKDLIKDWQPHGSDHFATAKMASTLREAEDLVIDVVKKRLATIMNR